MNVIDLHVAIGLHSIWKNVGSFVPCNFVNTFDSSSFTVSPLDQYLTGWNLSTTCIRIHLLLSDLCMNNE